MPSIQSSQCPNLWAQTPFPSTKALAHDLLCPVLVDPTLPHYDKHQILNLLVYYIKLNICIRCFALLYDKKH